MQVRVVECYIVLVYPQGNSRQISLVRCPFSCYPLEKTLINHTSESMLGRCPGANLPEVVASTRMYERIWG